MQSHETTRREGALYTPGELAEELALSRKTIDRMDAAGKLPRALRIGARAKRWRREEIQAWLAAGGPPREEWEASRPKPARSR